MAGTYDGPNRRRENGLDFSGLPTWAKAMSVVGFPAFVSLFFMAQAAGYVPSPASRVESVVLGHITQMETVRAQAETQAGDIRRLARVMAQVCRNTAKSEGQVLACDQ